MKKFFCLFAFFLFATISNAQEVVSLNNASLTIFLPEKPNGMAVLCCPGGGYETVCDEHEGKGWAEEINQMGVAWIVVNYQLPNGNPKIPFSSVESAMKYVKAHAKKYHINPNQIGIAGFSAGGHLAATYTRYASKNLRPAFQILFYPVISMDSSLTHLGSFHHLLGNNPSEKMIKKYSLEKQTTKQIPSTIIFVSNDDNVVPKTNATLYSYNVLKKDETRKDFKMVEFPEGNHGWGNSKTFKYHDEVITQINSFLETWKNEHSSQTE